MKKFITLTLCLVVFSTFFACGKVEGDLGQQTSVTQINNKEIVVVSEVKPFEYEDYEDTFEEKENLRSEGFKVTPENSKGEIDLKGEVREIAQSEATVDYNWLAMYQDRSRGIWMVELGDMTETETDKKIDRTIDVKEVIFIDEDGYTLYAYTE